MTISYGFYNSVAGDRVYDAIQMSRIFDGIILDGVYAALGDYFLVTENTTPDMDVLVGTGRAWFNHTWTYNDADITITVPTASPLLPRIDVVYLEVNEDTAVRANKVDILQGTPASSPVAPTLTNTATVHQYPLAHIYVGVSVTSITQANITNKVGTAETPFVTCPLDYVETDDLLAEWETQWLEWFDAIKDQLSTEAETNLQAQIWDLAGVASGAPPYADDMVSLASHDHSGAHPQIPAGGIATGAVTESKIGTGAVTNTKLGTDSVTATKIAASAVGNSELATNAVTQIKMADNSVGTAELINGNVTNAKMANNSIDTNQLINGCVTVDKIGAGGIILSNRVGGSSTDWDVAGDTLRSVNGTARIFAGSSEVIISAGTWYNGGIISFGGSAYFTENPIVIVSVENKTAWTQYAFIAEVASCYPNQFSLIVKESRMQNVTADETVNVHWIAIGLDI